jgi:hypothetical protein
MNTNDFKYEGLDAVIPNEYLWERIRNWRNAELASTDWTQVADAPVDKAAWATYRQALRDLPAQGGLADAAKFPVAP